VPSGAVLVAYEGPVGLNAAGVTIDVGGFETVVREVEQQGEGHGRSHDELFHLVWGTA
jgi:hypothetical protein